MSELVTFTPDGTPEDRNEEVRRGAAAIMRALADVIEKSATRSPGDDIFQYQVLLTAIFNTAIGTQSNELCLRMMSDGVMSFGETLAHVKKTLN